MSGIEVLEPYPNEILYSWLSRMFYWYGFCNNPISNIRDFNTILFGINSRSINNILIPHNLQDLIERINLVNSEYFKTPESLIRTTTIMPFYFAFLTTNEQKEVFDNLIHRGPMNITKSILGLKDINSLMPDYKLKFCYQCWVENEKIFFVTEHQIRNNYLCYKHNTRLQYVIISSKEYLKFDNSCIDHFIDSPYCISANDINLSIYMKIAVYVHEIISNGFRDDIVKIKAKIRIKMLDMGYMSNDFNNIKKFDEFWSSYSKYNVLNIDKRELINALYTTSNNPDPILYLTLIIYIYGTLDLFYEQQIDERDIRIINQKLSKVISLTQSLKPYGFIYYNNLRYWGLNYKFSFPIHLVP